MRTILRVIDSISEWTGKVISWFCVALIIVLCYEVMMRYVFNAPTIWVMETSMMIGGTIILMGWSYVHQQQAHVRVDVIYTHLSARGKAIINVVCALLFFFPVVIILIYNSAWWMLYSWSMNEKMYESSWYPPVGPIKTVMVLGLSLLALQGVTQFVRDLYLLIRNKPYD